VDLRVVQLPKIKPLFLRAWACLTLTEAIASLLDQVTSYRLVESFVNRKFSALASMLLLVLLSACATAPPVQEMSDARQAIAAARQAGAESHAAVKLQEAELMLESAENYLQTGSSNGYWSARRAALSAKDTALDALLVSRGVTNPDP
jgi:hypothetical protein